MVSQHGLTLAFHAAIPGAAFERGHGCIEDAVAVPPCLDASRGVLKRPCSNPVAQVAAIQEAMGDTQCPDPKAPTDVRRRLLGDSAAAVAKPAAASKAAAAAKPLAMPHGSTEEEWKAAAAGPGGWGCRGRRASTVGVGGGGQGGRQDGCRK